MTAHQGLTSEVHKAVAHVRGRPVAKRFPLASGAPCSSMAWSRESGLSQYPLTYVPEHLRGRRLSKRIPTHILVAEKALGKPLPYGVLVHHWDHDKANFDPSNLVICQDAAYHGLIHTRQRAYEECGNPNWRKCRFCQIYDDPEIMSKHSTKDSKAWHHKLCYNEYRKRLR